MCERFRHLLTLGFFCVLAAQTSLAQPATPGSLVEVTALGVVEPDEIRRLAAPLFAPAAVPPLELAVETYGLRYLTTGLDGAPTEVFAQLFVPVYATPEARPLYVFGSGTTGIADKCAPSREAEYPHPLGHYRAYMLAYASRGFVGIFPNYLGFDDPERTQAYFNALAEGRVMLDAVRAAYAFFEQYPATASLSGAVFTAGYSQGGHAAFAAADLRPTYAPELPLTGIIGYGATTNVARLLREGPYYAPYIVQSYSTTYGEAFDPAAVLNARWLPTLQNDVGTRCVDEVQTYYPFDSKLVYAPEFAAALYGDTLTASFPNVARILEENRTGLSGHKLPALIVQGEDDVIVRNPTQTLFVSELCAAQSSVLYLSFPAVRHRYTRQIGFEPSLAWMESLARGEAAPSVCGD